MSELTKNQIEIMKHTRNAAGGFYCGGGPDMDSLVSAGLMELAGYKSFVPDAYYKLTRAGRHILMELSQRGPK